MSQEERLLDSIQYPSDLKKYNIKDLPQISDELRQFIIDEVSENPGHFGASLGVVELTVALHYVFNAPEDKIIWDTGHQAYAHKILTGRKDRFHTNRQYKGISGFPKRSESEYDAFGVVYEAGVADGSEAWIWVSGSICQILWKNSTSATMGNIALCADTDGRGIDTANPGGGLPGTDTHFKEVGHVLETNAGGTDQLVLVHIHFN